MLDKQRFFLGSSTFSIYEEMAVVLSASGRWTAERDPKRMERCAVILGDRFDIPYHLFTGPVAANRPRLVNYFRGSHKLTLKASMTRVLREALPHGAPWMPLSFVLGGKQGGTDDRQQLQECAAAQASPMTWIVKPSAGCGGTGIVILSDVAAVCAHVDAINSDGKALFVVQRYIDRPLLLDGRKFDIRVWVLLTHPYNIYQFSEGSCRTSSVRYDASNIAQLEAHVTNHCLQETSEDFGKYEEGNELWYAQLDAYVEKTKGVPNATRDVLKPQFAEIAKQTLLSVRDLLEVPPGASYQNFQLFGYDFLVDDDLRVHLLEINGSPGAAKRWLRPLVVGMLDVLAIPHTSAGESEGTVWEPVWSPIPA